MRHDMQLRAAARAIYDECYPSEEWSALPFEDAERFGTVHYRQAVGAAQRAKAVLSTDEVQLLLAAVL
ncbi:hypothetical protein LPN01_07830 [Sphingomonas sp. A2-49]|uniref:hypothetical protein n=1 Tax=Sphingomonas sp. A2-49 TaxID=1391375 RepID=UPI0021D1C762|nr:hypothetical protein [Sphingomonas sp. A2-49]MCU6453983.1 hypothetical protein [Sphingomonas sp. A2-49]